MLSFQEVKERNEVFDTIANGGITNHKMHFRRLVFSPTGEIRPVAHVIRPGEDRYDTTLQIVYSKDIIIEAYGYKKPCICIYRYTTKHDTPRKEKTDIWKLHTKEDTPLGNLLFNLPKWAKDFLEDATHPPSAAIIPSEVWDGATYFEFIKMEKIERFVNRFNVAVPVENVLRTNKDLLQYFPRELDFDPLEYEVIPQYVNTVENTKYEEWYGVRNSIATSLTPIANGLNAALPEDELGLKNYRKYHYLIRLTYGVMNNPIEPMYTGCGIDVWKLPITSK